MRGNHRIWGRQDYTPPPALTEKQLAVVASYELRPMEGRRRPTFEVYHEGALVAWVRSGVGGPEFMRVMPDPFWNWTPFTQDVRPDDPPYARSIVLIDEWNSIDAEELQQISA